MKVSIARSGTLVPIVTTTELDSAALTPPEATKLAELVAGAGIGGPEPARGPIQPDRGSLRITIDDGPTQASLAAPDADLPAGARALVDWVNRHSGAIRRIEPPGS